MPLSFNFPFFNAYLCIKLFLYQNMQDYLVDILVFVLIDNNILNSTDCLEYYYLYLCTVKLS